MLIATIETSVRTTDNIIIFLAFISLGLIFVGTFVIPFKKSFGIFNFNRFLKNGIEIFCKIEEICENKTPYYRSVTIEMESWLRVSKDNPMIKDVTNSYKLENWQKRLKYKVWKLCINGYVYIVEQITPISVSIGLDRNNKIYILKAKTINKWLIKNFKQENFNYIFFPEVYGDTIDFAATCNSFTRMTLRMMEIEKVEYKKRLRSLGFKI